jgi:cation diffusion facilitator family transporter
MNAKIKIARLSVISNTLLIIMKLVVGIISGSVSIISEAIHSSMDLIAAIIAFFSVKVSDNPPDSRHPYGHGRLRKYPEELRPFLYLSLLP